MLGEGKRVECGGGGGGKEFEVERRSDLRGMASQLLSFKKLNRKRSLTVAKKRVQPY